ncbi:MAG: hypothetical protein E7566_01475 [Ruminococcaceae bacterium]|nr:hypothetical protein [Oscillospiraceae bacterium]
MKKRLSVILTLCLLLFSISPTFAFSYEAKSETLAATDSVKLVPVKFGDSDFDNRVSIKDATLIQKHVAGLITLTEDQLLLSDVDGNTRVNIVDATWVQKKVASIVDIFPVEENKPEETTTTEPIEPTVPTTQTTATEPVEPTIPTTQTTATEPVEPTIPTTQTTATEPVEPTVPTTQTTATEPVEPTAPTTQTTATEPVEPTAPTTQTTATEPVEPTTPSVETTIPKPEEPTKPSKPEPPERPSKPENYKPIDTIDGDSISTETLWKIEEGFLRLVNEERASKGLNPISHNKALDDAAQVRSAELIISYSHTRPNGEKYSTAIDKDLYRYAIVGENVYAVYGTHTGKKEYICNDEQVEYIYTKFFNDFKNSPTHYENMMYEEFKDTGIGITYIWNDEVGLPCFYISHIFGVTR